jgi:acyl carrier protein
VTAWCARASLIGRFSLAEIMAISSPLDDEIRGILRAHARLNVDVGTLDSDADLYRAGMTSHASVNLMLALEDKFGVEFPERMLRRRTFETIAAIGAAMRELTGGAPEAAT